MPYFSTNDERGLLNSAGSVDAPSSLNNSYYVAEGQYAYGELTFDGLSDRDVYSLGFLGAGTYRVDVDDQTWDVGNFDFGSVSSFRVLNSFGGWVETSFGAFSDIEFTATTGATYYVEIIGPIGSDAQYRLSYELLTATNTPTAWGSSTYSGSLAAGSTLDASVLYFDADGNSDGL